MKKSFLIGLLGISLLISGCKKNPFVVTIYAQTFPVNRTLAWDASVVDITHAAADNYIVRLGTNIVATLPASQLTLPITFPALGSYTYSVTATNQWGTSTASSITVNVLPPNSATNPRINP